MVRTTDGSVWRIDFDEQPGTTEALEDHRIKKPRLHRQPHASVIFHHERLNYIIATSANEFYGFMADRSIIRFAGATMNFPGLEIPLGEITCRMDVTRSKIHVHTLLQQHLFMNEVSNGVIVGLADGAVYAIPFDISLRPKKLLSFTDEAVVSIHCFHLYPQSGRGMQASGYNAVLIL
ncbi:uncharacterized protein BYT42DRAFT_589875, partial [Radiomyces spectabilis]|uniref:uncharacterized protein n=1 Tax=Radiomyces spectabilis TaxID=64574 RepID=UPI00221F651D